MADIDVEDVLSKLDLEEKVSLLAGIDFWHTQAIHKHGIPTLRTSDGPNGVRGTRFFNGIPAACFPCGTALGSTFDQELLVKAGKLMGDEAKAKGAHILLGPCINMQRSPLGGRGLESISEDPLLAGLGAAALIKGIQSTGVVSTIKHFVTNDQEHERMAVNGIVTERALREIYLMPFQIAVRDAHPHAFMTAYNKLNGTHLSENKKILQDTLRDEWGWKGVVMSDWFGTYSTSDAINAGLDLEMPGPTRWRAGLLEHLVSSRRVPIHILDERVRNMLNLVKQCKTSGVKEWAKEGTNDTPETAKLLRRLAADSCVLLKNERDALPLKKNKSVLLIGPNARTSVFCGGGSSSMAPYYAVSPFDGVKSKLKDPSKLQHTIGCYSHKELPLASNQFTVSSDPKSRTGLVFKAYNEPPCLEGRSAVDEIVLTNTYSMLMDYKHPLLEDDLWYANVEGYFQAERTGEYELGLCVYGTGNLFVDDKLVVDNTTKQAQGSVFFGCGTVEEKGRIHMEEGKTYHVKLEFASAPASKLDGGGVPQFGGGGFRIGGAWVLDMGDTVAEAVRLASEAEQVVICAGLNQDSEGEGADRADMKLPGSMDELITKVAEANPRTVVVNQTGTPVEMPWIDKVAGLVQAWYGGNETGNGIADVLFGDVNPSGRSSMTWPKRCEDNPAFYNYRSEGGRTLYGEDVYIGYRHCETVKRDVNVSFGYGLSYTTFELSGLKVSKSGADELSSKVTVNVMVKNTGKLEGQEGVQVYVRPQNPGIRRPPRELKGFTKVAVKAGAKAAAKIEIPLKYAASYWDEIRDAWVLEKGKYDLEVNDGSRMQESLVNTIEVSKTIWWNGL
ncbi:beta-glucosidase [Vermiconidia calcicola]|uniref:Beta-glucosidase n=1 Tax=Vermiconidia calcicola TaxID=1690605 RepID=A0ACC3MW16_9PEZI|nr:beta-glucosidase [Vermiconidia calcicola]